MSFLRKLLLFFGLFLFFVFQTNARSQTVTQRPSACNAEKATCERKLTANTKELKDCKKGNQGSNAVANCKSDLKSKTDAANKCSADLLFSQLATTGYKSQLSSSDKAKKRCESDLDSNKTAVADCKGDEIEIKDTLSKCTDYLRRADQILGKMPPNLDRIAIALKNETKLALQAKWQCLEKADKLEHKLKYECRPKNGAGGPRTNRVSIGGTLAALVVTVRILGPV